MNEIRYCPVHGTPDDILNAFPCTTDDEDDLCPFFEAELAKRIREVTEDGNFFRLIPRRNIAGCRLVQEYRNHQPYGEPQPLKRRPPEPRDTKKRATPKGDPPAPKDPDEQK